VNLSYSFQTTHLRNRGRLSSSAIPAVFRDGDAKASEFPNLLLLKTTVEKYTPGSETRHAGPL
jgi:hypothetical protein